MIFLINRSQVSRLNKLKHAHKTSIAPLKFHNLANTVQLIPNCLWFVATFLCEYNAVYPYHNISIQQVIKKHQFHGGNKEVCLLPVL